MCGTSVAVRVLIESVKAGRRGGGAGAVAGRVEALVRGTADVGAVRGRVEPAALEDGPDVASVVTVVSGETGARGVAGAGAVEGPDVDDPDVDDPHAVAVNARAPATATNRPVSSQYLERRRRRGTRGWPSGRTGMTGQRKGRRRGAVAGPLSLAQPRRRGAVAGPYSLAQPRRRGAVAGPLSLAQPRRRRAVARPLSQTEHRRQRAVAGPSLLAAYRRRRAVTAGPILLAAHRRRRAVAGPLLLAGVSALMLVAGCGHRLPEPRGDRCGAGDGNGPSDDYPDHPPHPHRPDRLDGPGRLDDQAAPHWPIAAAGAVDDDQERGGHDHHPSTQCGRPDGAAACAPTQAATLASTGAALQLITVVAPTFSSTNVTVALWQRRGSCWVGAGGPWAGVIGANGFSDHHREGDDTTPTGIYAISPLTYGNAPNPGVRGAYHQLVCGDWWDEDPTSTAYNTFQHISCGTAPPFAADSEALWTETEAYPSFAVVEYNTDPVVAYAGSAIFVHATIGRPTAGCVSIPRPDLDQMLRWLNPVARPMIAMGPAGEISRF